MSNHSTPGRRAARLLSERTRSVSPLRPLLVAALLLTLAACANSPPIPDGPREKFELTRDLAGKTVGRGNFNAIDGTDRDFVAYIDGSWDGQVMTLVEDFEYADGVQETKTWKLTRLPNGEYSGVREDVIGTARGFQDGDAFRLEYTMAIPDDEGKPGRKVRFRDVLVKQSDGAIRNEAIVGFWGIRVGRVSLIITREEQ
ncbi:MAG: DUF3833 family protein [Granulosicoccus sp.]|nr:DUF3833 family protein [Granulosicoccus sp.]